MKTGKRIIAMVLAFVLALSVMPMAFATDECEHVFNEETLVRPTINEKGHYICPLCDEKVYVELADYRGVYKAFYELSAIDRSVYVYEKPFEVEMQDYFYIKYTEIEDIFVSKSWTENEQEEVDTLTVRLEELTEEYSNYLIKIGAVKVVDAREYAWWETYTHIIFYLDHTEEERKQVMDDFSQEISDKAFESREAVSEYLSNAHKNPEKATQEEFDKLAEDNIRYLKAICNCLENNHQFTKGTDNADGTHSLCCYYCTAPTEQTAPHEWGEYISNGDATVNSDGTKTAKCTYCEATDTVVDEGSKLDDDTTVLITYIVEFLKLLIEFIKSIFIK